MKYLLILFLCLNVGCSKKIKEEIRPYEFRMLSVDKLKDDVETLYGKLDSIHYDLYHNHSRIEFESKVSEIKLSIENEMNSVEFYRHILPIYGMLKDAHSVILFPFEYSKVYAKQGGKFIPFKVLIKDNKIYITENLSKKEVPIYSEIKTINTKKVEEIIEDLNSLSNNEIMKSEEKYMSYFFPRIMYPYYGFDKIYDIELIRPNGSALKLKVDGIDLSEMKNEKKSNFNFYTIADNIGILDLNRCEDKEHFGSFCDSVFQELREKKISNLIIDLRDNGGGSTFHGDTLLSYISRERYTQYPKVKIKMSSEVDNEIDSTYIVTYDDETERIHENKHLYKGRVFMIINNNSFSSASLLAATFKCYKMGKLIGQETGGTQIFFDEPLLLTLPNSKLRYLISHQLRWVPCGEEMNKGIVPDHIVKWNKNDEIQSVDTEIKFIKGMIDK